MKVLVTGSSGCLGRACVDLLARRADAEVVIAGRSAPENAGSAGFVPWDVSAAPSPEVEARARDATAFVHLAAGAGVWFAAREPLRDLEVGVGGTLRAVELARRAGIRRFVLASTVLVYADTWDADDDSEVRPSSAYGAGKLAAETYLGALAAPAGLEPSVLRLSWCYGPGMRRGPVADVLRWVREPGQPLRLYHDLESEYDLLSAKDGAAALVAAALEPGWAGARANVATGETARLREVVELAARVVGREPAIQLERRTLVRARVRASTARRLGWSPSVSWREGLEELFTEARRT